MLEPSFIAPQYQASCFSDIPQTIKYLLTGQGEPLLSRDLLADLPQKYETVILFFVDAFGWRFFEKHADDYPFLKHIVSHGATAQLTSQFPSTTAAHATCIHTGLTVGQSGLYEWQYYEPQLDALIAPLLFSFAGTTKRETLKTENIDPKQLYPTQTVYQDLKAQGVTSYAFQASAYTPSTYSDIMFQGAEVIPYRTLPEALVNLQHLLIESTSPAYFFLYYGSIDAICHKYGPNSPQLEAEIDLFLTMMDRLFLQQVSGRLSNSLFIMTADHGQVEVDPETTIYLNQEPQFAGIEQYLRRNQKGNLLVPAGSARDMFLYLKTGMVDEAQAFLSSRLAGKGVVYKVSDLIERGFFGPLPVSPAFLSRVGDLVILPYAGESVWWYQPGQFNQPFYGHHGGLTRAEMEIPLLLYDFSA